MKWLLWLLIAGLGVLWLTRSLRSALPPAKAGGAKAPGAPQEALPVAILACSHCGVHAPERDMVRDAEQRPYCCEAHRRAGPALASAARE